MYQIDEVQEFTVYNRKDPEQLIVTRLHRINDKTFRIDKKNGVGEMLESKSATAEFAQVVLTQASVSLSSADLKIQLIKQLR